MSGEIHRIPQNLIDAMYAHAAKGYPEEVCGLLFGPKNGGIDEIRQCVNHQNELHEKDPATYPRNARTAYNLGFDDLQLIDRSQSSARPVKVIYHSHVDVGAYFSAEDKRMACPPEWGEPLFPDIDYLVVDAQRDGARGAKLFRFSDGDFVEIAAYSRKDPQTP